MYVFALRPTGLWNNKYDLPSKLLSWMREDLNSYNSCANFCFCFVFTSWRAMLSVKWLTEANCRAENSVISGGSNTLQILELFSSWSKKTLRPICKKKLSTFHALATKLWETHLMSNSQAWVFTGLCDFVSRGFIDNNENDMTVLTITITLTIPITIIIMITIIIAHSKYFPNSDWLKAHA